MTEYLVNKLPVPTKRATVSLFKVKPCHALLRMVLVLVRVSSYMKCVLGYKSPYFYTYHPDTLYLSKQGCEDPPLFLVAKRGTRSKEAGETLV
jgi:hypothetical protein